MLKELRIRNFAIIEVLEITFSNGLTVLSGETGAGKSIIINALNLLLGHRATGKYIRTGAKTAEVEGFFEINDHPQIKKIMDINGLDSSNGLLIRRIISRKDRHKIFINDRQSTIQLLSQLTSSLVNISGQHAHQRLLNEDEHLLILDQFGKLMPLRIKVYDLYHQLIPLIEQLKKLQKQQARQAEHIELMRFQAKEITEADIQPKEDEKLENEQIRLQHAETIYQKVNQSIEQLYDSDGAIVEILSKVQKDVEQASSMDKSLSDTCERIQEANALIDDITSELRQYLEGIKIDDQRLQIVEDRIYLLSGLKRKYGGSIESIEAHLKNIYKELDNQETIEEKIVEAEKNVSQVYKQLKETIYILSEKRKNCAGNLSHAVEKELHQLKMNQTRFQVKITHKNNDNHTDEFLTDGHYVFTETGIDRSHFMIAPNVGEEMKPLASIASGGELSRIVLALKAILSGTESVSTVVFDEVDSGIGGGVAEMVGQKMVALSNHHQIICITHLPQIAKYGQHHFRIEKHVNSGRTHTTISPIDHKERINEIARMLGGEIITEKTIEHAREMIGSTSV
ncbi:DNA repair and genetic recombination protein [Candidatus Magnetomorum sp. HK-1]|nr:DNA repair and genetic recombination protein [Candidatus Magnetomorum sp. HK-1]